jgi:hypothetical protein
MATSDHCRALLVVYRAAQSSHRCTLLIWPLYQPSSPRASDKVDKRDIWTLRRKREREIIKLLMHIINIHQSYSVDMIKGWKTRKWGSLFGKENTFCTSQRPDHLWGPSTFQINVYRCLFPRNKRAETCTLPLIISHVLRFRIRGAKPPFFYNLSWHSP